ncbi:MAG TPA: hypothetical protein VFE47_13415 [Tepidisphaeraceae bacterium]|jgi:hypothetical protein|nr:hypothetical protein [Tepidisphaeraceae bacterium]
MHERNTPQHEKRLVVVFLTIEGPQVVSWQFSAYCFHSSYFPEKVPGNWAGGLGIESEFRTAEDPHYDSVRVAKFYAGQCASNDASRFSIRIDLDGKESFIDGQLVEDDKVKMIVRGGPAALPERWWVITPGDR